ncbi:MAG TPA: transglutaminase domain-containing protein [Saprospiraceae bacterium]|nr:transglutaminase domain-containing protein [Saprospiraceae bacterium]
MIKLSTSLFSLLLFFILMACQAETPSEEAATKTAPVQPKADIADVEAGIRAYIDRETAARDGYFHVENDTLDLDLKLVRVHTEYLSVLGPNDFFACVDLATTTGDVYDVDFFLVGEPGDMKVTRTDIHKRNGQPFYTWKRAADNTWNTVPVNGASNDLLGVLQGKDEFVFHYAVVLPEIIGEAKVWLPVARRDRFQEVALLKVSAPTEYQTIEENQFGNQALYLELKPEHSGQTIQLDYAVTRLEKAAYREDDTDLEQYMTATPLLPVGGRFDTLSQKIIDEKEADTELMKARALYDYVVDNVRYAKQGKYGTADANFACDEKSGNCTEFHSLFISLARSAGIPARFAVGAAIPSARNEGGINGYHCWAEFYAEGKWWPVDISEANKYSNLATYYFGHHPANRIELSKGRNIQFTPGPVSGPLAFFAYPKLEVQGVEVPVAKTTFSFERREQG